MERTGIVGIGRMGGWMAQNLLKKGYPLICYDVRRDAVEEMVKKGAKGAVSLKDVAVNSDIVFAMVVNASQLRNITIEKDGLFQYMKSGSVLVITSTVSPKDVRDISEKAAEKGIDLIDAPVSGAQAKAKDGTMTLMAACRDIVWERCREVLETVGSGVVHVSDDPGIGQVFKAVNQMLVMVNKAMTAEVVLLAERAGADLGRLVEVIKNSRGNSVIFENTVQKYIDRDFSPAAALSISRKDLSIAFGIAEECRTPIPVTKTVLDLYSEADERGWGQEDQSAIMRLYEDMCDERKEA